MFSNKYRFLKITVIFFTLIGLAYYGQIQGPKVIPGLKEFRENPTQYINQEVEFGGKIKEINQDNFSVEQKLDGGKMILNIKGALKNAKVEDNIHGVFVCNIQKELVLNRYIITNSRPIKIIVSFIALLIVLYLFLKKHSFNFRKIEFNI